MATISTQFNLIDRMSSPLQKINSVLDLVVDQMQAVDNASDLGFNNSAINATNDCLVAVTKNIQNINNKSISIKSNVEGTTNIVSSINNIENKVDSVNKTPIAVTSKTASMSNITNGLNNVQNSINSINKTPINITDDLNKNITTTNKFQTSLNSVKNTINSITGKSINLTTNTSSLIKAKSLLSSINNDLKSNEKSQNDWNNSINSGTSLYSKLAGVIGGLSIGYGIKTLGTTFISSAADLEATEAKFNTVFAGFTQQAQTIVDDFKMLTPATESSTRSMVSGIQDLLVPMGFARSEATNMTSEIMTLTGAFTSALVGEYDPLK